MARRGTTRSKTAPLCLLNDNLSTWMDEVKPPRPGLSPSGYDLGLLHPEPLHAGDTQQRSNGKHR